MKWTTGQSYIDLGSEYYENHYKEGSCATPRREHGTWGTKQYYNPYSSRELLRSFSIPPKGEIYSTEKLAARKPAR